MPKWTIHSLLQTTSAYFKKLGLPSHRLDADLLLAHSLGMDRLHLYMHADQPLTPDEVDSYRALVKRRAAREPIAYIVGQREFYSVALAVGPGVLIPRPETEVLVDKALEALKGDDAADPPLLIDVCTGSGAIPIAVLKNDERARALATDLSPEALSWAKKNVETHDLSNRLGLLQGDLFAPIPPRFMGKAQVITANPPYLTAEEMASLDPDVAHEPSAALDGGDDAGLTFYRRLAREASPWLKIGGVMLMEIGAGQGEAVGRLMSAAGWGDVEVIQDLARLDRVVRARRAG